MSEHYVLDGKEPRRADVLEWAAFLKDGVRRRVALDEVDRPVGRVTVSTVFLGLDHRFGSSGPPILFETMCFVECGGSLSQMRYATWADAEAGHAKMVATIEAGECDEAIALGGD